MKTLWRREKRKIKKKKNRKIKKKTKKLSSETTKFPNKQMDEIYNAIEVCKFAIDRIDS